MLLQDEEETKFGFVENPQRIHRDDLYRDQDAKSIYQVLDHACAEHVFDLVSRTESKIRFVNGETPYLLFNNQLWIHPSAVSQLIHGSPGGTTKTDDKNECEVAKNALEVVLRTTQQYDTSQISEKKYLVRIYDVLQKHQMIAEAEISAVQSRIMQQINLSDEQKKMFENMRPTIAFRFRTVLMGACLGDMAAAMKIALCVGGDDMVCNPVEIAHSIEISKIHFSMRMKLLAMRCADSVINNEQRRAKLVKHINEGISLAVQYEMGLLPFSSPMGCYYHVEKHGTDAVPAFYFEAGIDVPQNPWSRENIFKIYFEEMPKLLFTKENYRSTIVSQDGKTITRKWATRMVYVGYTKAPYTPVPNVDLSSDSPLFLPGETIATHFQEDKKDIVFHMLLHFLPRDYEYGIHGIAYGASRNTRMRRMLSVEHTGRSQCA
ncbi:hypothetical protein Aduo_005322 [Ancylostoma duodenale]